MSAKDERPVHFLDPRSKVNGTKYRSSLCDKRVVYLEKETQKLGPQKKRKNAIDDTIRLRTPFKSSEQGYYTRNRKAVTCKNCRRIMAGKKKGNWLGDSRWEVRFIGDKKNGGWIVIGDGALKKIFPGASRKNREEAQRIVNEENRKLADEVKHGNV